MKVNSNTIVSFIVLVFSLALISCGAKPKDMEPGDNYDPQKFPRTYPDIKTDPMPPVRHP